MDSPRSKVIDNFYKTIYKDHYYGYTNTVIFDNLPNITKEDVVRLKENNVDAVLIGETLMKSDDKKAMILELKDG